MKYSKQSIAPEQKQLVLEVLGEFSGHPIAVCQLMEELAAEARRRGILCPSPKPLARYLRSLGMDRTLVYAWIHGLSIASVAEQKGEPND